METTLAFQIFGNVEISVS